MVGNNFDRVFWLVFSGCGACQPATANENTGNDIGIIIELIFWISLMFWLIRKSKKYEKDATIKEELLKNNNDKKQDEYI